MRAGLADSNHRRDQRLVVVAGHGAAVCAGNRHGENVTALQIGGQLHLVNHNVAGFAVHTAHAGEHRFSGTSAIRQTRGVVGTVECRTNVVGHAAIHGHVHALGNRIAGTVFDIGQVHVLDGAHAVQGYAGGRHDVAAGLEADGRGGHAERTVDAVDCIRQASEFHVNVH